MPCILEKGKRTTKNRDKAFMKRPIDLINERYNSLRKSEQRVARFIQNHVEEVVLLSLQSLANKCSTSDATVLRFCRSLGFYGFSDFKASLVPQLVRNEHTTHLEVDPNLDYKDKKVQFLQNFQQQLKSTLRNCDYDEIKKVATRISQADKTLITGLGGSAGVAHIFSDSLGSIGVFSTCPLDTTMMLNLVSMHQDNDVLVCISHSGETEEIVFTAKQAREQGMFTVGITNFSPSPLVENVEVSLITGVSDNLLGSYSCQSRISQLAILELVLYEVSQKLAADLLIETNR